MPKKSKRPDLHKNKHHHPKKTYREEVLQNTKECMVVAQKRAQKIFLNLVEVTVSREEFIEMLCFINPDIYEEVTADRAASGVCGYPQCSKDFVDLYGERQFVIRSNVVYDLSDRKKFCSPVCYEASEIVKGQLSMEPLYLRENIPSDTLKVKVPDVTHLKGRHGKPVDITGGINLPYSSKLSKPSSFTSFTEIAEESLKMCAENKDIQENSEFENKEFQNTDAEEPNDSNTDEAKQRTQMCTEKGKNRSSGSHKKAMNTWRDRSDCEKPIIEGHECWEAVFEIEQAFREWMTFESLRFTVGDLYVKGMLEDVGEKWENIDSTEGLKLSVEAKARYIELCRKLAEQEREDECGPDLESHEVYDQPKQPLPDYKQLQMDAKEQKLKVVSFLGGSDQYENMSVDEDCKTSDKDVGSTLPLIDSYSQVEWRRAIVFEKLEKYLTPFLPLAQLEETRIKSLIKELIMTFSFSPNNIIFKPGQWNLVTLLILKMLSIRISAVQQGIEKQDFLKLQETLLSAYDLDTGYLNRFLGYVTEIKHIIRKSKRDNTKQLDNNHQSTDISLSENLGKISVGEEEEKLENKKKTLECRQLDTILEDPTSTDNVVSSTTEELD